MAGTDEFHLTHEEESALKALANRQRQSEFAESAMLQKYANRAVLARQVWGVAASCVCAIVLGTVYVFSIKNQVDQNTKAIDQIHVFLRQNSDAIFQLRIDMKDKAERDRP